MALLEEVIRGVYVGILTGAFTGFLAFLLAFGFQYVAGVKLSDRIALLIGLGVAGLQATQLLRDPDFLRSPTVLSALLVVMLVTLYAHQRGVELGEQLPKGVLTRRLWRRTLSSDVVERIGRFGQVRVRIVGEIGDVEGYPPLPERLRTEIAESSWTYPADLPLTELERRLADSLRSEYDLAAVQVSIDAEARATVAAAPTSGSLSQRVPGDRRGVSVDAKLPSGLGRGDEVELAVDGESITGTVLSVAAPPASDSEQAEAVAEPEAKDPGATPPRTTTGSAGRATVAVDPTQVDGIMQAGVSGLLARSRGGGPEFELVSLLRSNGDRFRKLTVRPDSEADGAPISQLNLRQRYGVDVLALQRAGAWTFAPTGPVELQAGDDLFAAGPREGIESLAEVVL